MRQDGATIIIKGSGIVEHNQDVEITLSSLLRDTQGNPLNQDRTLAMRLPDLYRPNGDGTGLRSPVAAVFPGFSCALYNVRRGTKLSHEMVDAAEASFSDPVENDLVAKWIATFLAESVG